MRVICAVCKKQPIPSDRRRSFHQFPQNNDLKQKWMEILGITLIKNSWRVCSDHFCTTSFHEPNGYNCSKRRILPNALPNNPSHILSAPLSEMSNVKTKSGRQMTLLLNEKDHMKNNPQTLHNQSSSCSGTEVTAASNSANEAMGIDTPVISDVGEGERKPSATGQWCAAISKSLKPTFPAIDDHSYGAQNSSHIRENTGNSNLKRNRTNAGDQIRRTKKFCFKHGYTMKYLSRSDFVSDEAWDTFLLYTAAKENKVKSSRKTSLRKDEKIKSYKELIAALKKRNIHLQHSTWRSIETNT